MTEYRRLKTTGATCFFTVNCANRRGNQLLVQHIDLLRSVFRRVREDHPFNIDAIVILPDHLHCIWSVPANDAGHPIRWALIKAGFSRGIPPGERLGTSRTRRGERGIWQRRFWEHQIRNDRDLRQHIDYIHWNPVKHGWVSRVTDWPYSSFHGYVRRGLLPPDWAGGAVQDMVAGE